MILYSHNNLVFKLLILFKFTIPFVSNLELMFAVGNLLLFSSERLSCIILQGGLFSQIFQQKVLTLSLAMLLYSC